MASKIEKERYIQEKNEFKEKEQHKKEEGRKIIN